MVDGTPRRVYVCTRCLKAGKVTKAAERSARVGPDRVGVTDTNLVRFRAAVAGALAHLESRREEINDLNVFPVADGDTGDNMVLTLRAVLAELDRLIAAGDAHDGRHRPRRDRRSRWPAPRCSARAATRA